MFLGPALRARRLVAREGPGAGQFPPGRRRVSRRAERTGRRPAAAWPDRARPHPNGRPGRPAGHPGQHATRTTSARASGSPGGSTRATRPCSGAASAFSTRPSPCRASAICWPPTSSATGTGCRGGGLRNGFSRGTPTADPPTSATRGSIPTSRAPDIYQYNVTLERELPGEHGPARQLHRLDDAEAAGGSSTSTRCRRARCRSIRRQSGGLWHACRSRRTALHGHRRQPRQRPVRLRAARAAAPVEGRLGVERGLHAGPLRQQRARHRQQHDRPGAVRSRTTSRRIAAPIRTSSSTGSSPTRPGICRWATAASTAPTWPRWADALFGGWTVSTIVPGAQRAEPDAVLQRLLHDEPVEHRQAARWAGQLFLLRLAAGSDSAIRTPADRAMPSSIRPPMRSRHRANSATPRRGACWDPAPGS